MPSPHDDPERWAAERLAQLLDSAAQVFADAAETYRELARSARAGRRSSVGYAYLAGRAHTVAVSALPNLSLPAAFEMAATADRFRDEKKD